MLLEPYHEDFGFCADSVYAGFPEAKLPRSASEDCPTLTELTPVAPRDCYFLTSIRQPSRGTVQGQDALNYYQRRFWAENTAPITSLAGPMITAGTTTSPALTNMHHWQQARGPHHEVTSGYTTPTWYRYQTDDRRRTSWTPPPATVPSHEEFPDSVLTSSEDESTSQRSPVMSTRLSDRRMTRQSCGVNSPVPRRSHVSTPSDLDGERLGKRSRKQRTHFTQDQLDSLEEFFASVKYPDADQCEEYAERLDLTEDNIRTWFKNRRAKQKRESNTGKY